MRTYDNREALDEDLCSQLVARGVEVQLAKDLVIEVAPLLAESAIQSQQGLDLASPNARYVLKNEHLDIMEGLATGGGCAYLAGFFFGPADAILPGAQLAIGVGAGTIRLLMLAWRNVIRLSRRQAQIVLVLRAADGPVDVTALTEALKKASSQGGADAPIWDETWTQKVLDSLLKVPTKSGKPEAIVSQNESGAWQLSGI